jgi:hypothetical protein
MKHFVLALAIWGLSLFWGLGLSWLMAPRRWRRFWPVFAPMAGWSLLSAVVWTGARLGFAGTDSYALWSLFLPAILIAIPLWKRRGAWLRELFGFWPQWLLSLALLGVLTLPLSLCSRYLTTISLGSCDAADYAAGARVLKEFARTDRSGFIGNTEVVQLHSVDNFYDHWMRLNHFSPSALIAHHCSMLGCRPEHLISLFTASILALSLPLVFWVSRSLLRLGRGISFGIAALYGLCPLTWYAVYHVAPGQMLAAQSILLLTWAGIALWKGAAPSPRDLTGFGLALLAGYSLILGSYNFIVIVCLVPALAYACPRLFDSEGRKRLLPWLATMLVPLALAMVLFAERAAGLAERFMLFQQFDFGWKIPALSPEAWLGMVSDVSLDAYAPLLRWLLAAMVLGWFGLALFSEGRRRSGRAWTALCLTLPAIAGYLFLVVRGEIAHTNASYDAYKLLSVFLPGLLPSLALGFVFLSEDSWRRWLAASFALCVLLLNGSVAFQYLQRMSNPPLRVDTALSDLQKIDTMPQVTSVNMLIPEFWDRLWANAFLLHKKQYFETYTYEGRRNTELKGEWNLQGSMFKVVPRDRADFISVNDIYSLQRPHTSGMLRIRPFEGWYETERKPGQRWRWARGTASIMIDNPGKKEIRVKGFVRVRSLDERELQFWVDGVMLQQFHIGVSQALYPIPEFTLSQRVTRFEFRSPQPPSHASANDNRPLSFCLYGMELQLLP